MAAIILIASSTGAAISKQFELSRAKLPARIRKKGLATTELIKLESSNDNGVTWEQEVDENGVVQFAATGKNVIAINIPGLFRVNRTASAAASSCILSFGTDV